MSSLEVRLFVGTAAARVGNKSRYPSGEKHAFILYLSQGVGVEPDWERAEQTILAEHWGDIELTKTGIASQEKQMNYPFFEMYPHALAHGYSLLIYSGVEGEKV